MDAVVRFAVVLLIGGLLSFLGMLTFGDSKKLIKWMVRFKNWMIAFLVTSCALLIETAFERDIRQMADGWGGTVMMSAALTLVISASLTSAIVSLENLIGVLGKVKYTAPESDQVYGWLMVLMRSPGVFIASALIALVTAFFVGILLIWIFTIIEHAFENGLSWQAEILTTTLISSLAGCLIGRSLTELRVQTTGHVAD